jgi:glycerophosphoryl diester phosphodiesterase
MADAVKRASLRPLVIAHRGASGYRPEHTLAAYQLALDMGADFVEPDLVATRDGVLICRHENALAVLREDGSVDREWTSTDVFLRPGFTDRLCEKIIDGQAIRGWFSEDFTLAEIRQLRCLERIPHLRPGNTRWDGEFGIPTFAEVIALVRAHGECTGHLAGVYPETKHPSWFLDEGHLLGGRHIGLNLGEAVIRDLLAAAFLDPSRIFIQSFEIANLLDLKTRVMPAAGIDLPLIQLMSARHPPWDSVRAGRAMDWQGHIDFEALARYASGLGAERNLVLPRDSLGRADTPTALVAEAHAHGMDVHVWTLRGENHFLPAAFRRGEAPGGEGDLGAEVHELRTVGVDGFFTDNPDRVKAALDA